MQPPQQPPNAPNRPMPDPGTYPSAPPPSSIPPIPPISDEATIGPDTPTIVTPPTAMSAQPGMSSSSTAATFGQQVKQQGGGLWGRLRGMPQVGQVLIAVGAALVLMVCSCCSCSGIAAALNGESPSVQTTVTSGSSAHSGSGASHNPRGVASIASRTTATATAQPTVTAQPAAIPTQQPTATPKPQPTATPTPRPRPTATPKPCASPCNPWGYNFQCCNYIYSPPSNFCAYFSCINNFWNGKGYVMECSDGMYSKSGGRSGSCSYHGGNWRALLAR